MSLLDFNKIQSETIKVATYQPNLCPDESGNLMGIGDKTNGYDVITMNTCNKRNFPLYPGNMSDPSVYC
jgi:hypothetical protein